MTTEILPFELPCPKCGSPDIGRTFYANGQRVPNKDYDRNGNKYASGQCFQYYAFKDHISHHCCCCQYEWQTLPRKKGNIK